MMKLYLAASYRYRAVVEDKAITLRAWGFKVVSSWHAIADHDDIDRDILSPEHATLARELSYRDLDEIDSSDALLLFADPEPLSRGGKHFETGYAYGHGKKVHVIGHAEITFHRFQDVQIHIDLATCLRDLIAQERVYA